MIAQELSQQETIYEENRDNYKQQSQLLAAALRTHPQHEKIATDASDVEPHSVTGMDPEWRQSKTKPTLIIAGEVKTEVQSLPCMRKF